MSISVNQLDDFQDSTPQGWAINNGLTPIPVAEHEGPAGDGDHALYMSTADMGVLRLVVLNNSQWTGNWTSTGVAKVSLDVRNPNNFALSIRLGIAGPGGVGSAGSGDTYVTNAITVAANNAWHPLSFDVLAGNFTSTGGADAAAALTNVTQFRVIHNSAVSFIGAGGGTVYLDNIRALSGSPAGDYSGNGQVDAADYVVWRKTLNQTGSGMPADGTGPSGSPDGVVNGLDYQYWRARFGNTGSGAGIGAAVPEPAIELPVLIVAMFCSRRRTAQLVNSIPF